MSQTLRRCVSTVSKEGPESTGDASSFETPSPAALRMRARGRNLFMSQTLRMRSRVLALKSRDDADDAVRAPQPARPL
jgi:hypothetical protein